MDEDEDMEMEPSASEGNSGDEESEGNSDDEESKGDSDDEESEGDSDDEESDNEVMQLVQVTDALRKGKERPQKDTPAGKPSGLKVM